MTIVRVRPMTPQDIDPVMAIAATLPEAPHWPRGAYETALDPGSVLQRSAWIVEEPGHKIVAFAVVSVLPPQSELESIAVAADSQRRGLARRLLEVICAELKIFCVTEVILEVRASNSAARAFYTALGFVQTAIRPGYYSDPSEDAVLMALSIERADESAKADTHPAL